MTLHFAYGSNMSRAGMAGRCPTAAYIGRGVLNGWRFVVTADGYASVAPQPGGSVHGVLWRLGPRDLAALNAYENLDSGLYTRRTVPVLCNGKRVSALVYVGRTSEGSPRPGYLELVIAAARESGLPSAYISSIQRWLPGRWQGARGRDIGEVG
jgi:cation transport regulator ChaC